MIESTVPEEMKHGEYQRYLPGQRQIDQEIYELELAICREIKKLEIYNINYELRLQSLGKVLDELVIGGWKTLQESSLRRKKGFFVYALFVDDEVNPVYVGKSTQPLGRLGAHTSGSKYKKEWDYCRMVEVESEKAMKILEAELIHKLKPRYNVDQPRLDHRETEIGLHSCIDPWSSFLSDAA